MSDLSALIGDAQAIGAMTKAEFSTYWEALGTVVRIACKAAQPQQPEAPQAPAAPSRDPASTTSAATERTWQPTHQEPARTRAFGFTGGR